MHQTDLEIAPDGFISMALNAGHKILFVTMLPAPGMGWAEPKVYAWMKDVDGTIYLEKVEKN